MTTALFAPSPTQTFKVSGTGLPGAVTLTLPAGQGFEHALNGGNFTANALTLTPDNAGVLAEATIAVRLAAADQSGSRTGNLTVATQGLTTRTVSLAATVNGPVVTVSPTSLSGFAANFGTNSPAQTFTVSGTSLTGNIDLNAPQGYELARSGTTSFGTNLVLSRTNNAVAATTIAVRLAANAPTGPRLGNIDIITGNTTNRTVTLNGGVKGPILVSATAPNGGNGYTWATAMNNLQAAIDLAKPGDEIWVAKGTYKPTSMSSLSTLLGNGNDPKGRSFMLKGGVAIYGGFAGTEISRDQRDFESNETILSGDFLGNDDWSWNTETPNQGAQATFHDNAYSVVVADRLNSAAILDGLTVTGGNANAFSTRVLTPGTIDMLPLTRDTSFNVAGGVLIYSSDLVVRNCYIRRNLALSRGGGLFAFAGSVVVRNITNQANVSLNGKSSARVDVSTTRFEENIVPDYSFTKVFWSAGGAVSLADNVRATFRDVEFLSNSAPNGGAIGIGRSTSSPTSATPLAVLYRTLFYGNTAICSPAPALESFDFSGWDYLEDGDGGAINVSTGNIDLAACGFISNAAVNANGYKNNNSDQTTTGGGGGAIRIAESGKVRVATSLFTGNVTSAGGTISVANFPGSTGSSLEIYFSTVYGNYAYYTAGVDNYRASAIGRGNIFYENRSAFLEAQGGTYYDFANVDGSSASSVSASLFTLLGTLNFNGSTGNFSGNSEGTGNFVYVGGNQASLFANTADLDGGDNLLGTPDDGFSLRLGSIALNKANVTLPTDFADADGDGNFTEPLPLDARGSSFGPAPFDLGPYQSP